MPRQKLYYGWKMLPATLVFYSLGMGPAYYSWGFVAPEMAAELDLSKTQVGSIFGAFSFIYHMVAPLCGFAVARYGVRWVVTCAALLGAVGFYGVSRADSVFELYLYFGVFGGVGVGFGAILPAQALITYWFRRYRARAMAIVFAGGGLLSVGINPLNALILELDGWRTNWVVIGAVSFAVALVAAAFIRNRPEDLGLHVDGMEPDEEVTAARTETPGAAGAQRAEPRWTARAAIFSWPFLVITLCQAGYGAPWNIVNVHGRLHLETMDYTTAFIASIFSLKLALSTIGRFSSGLGDFIAPPKLLSITLVLEAIGILGFIFASTQLIAIASMAVLGIGFGASFVTIPLVISHAFGAEAFAVTQGTSRMINSVTGYAVPTLTGLAADISGTYAGALVVVAALSLVSAAALYFTAGRTPVEAPAAAG